MLHPESRPWDGRDPARDLRSPDQSGLLEGAPNVPIGPEDEVGDGESVGFVPAPADGDVGSATGLDACVGTTPEVPGGPYA